MPPESDTQDLAKARTFFQYGNDAAQKSNLDYAIDMYKQACKLAPGEMTFRLALRGAQRRKFNNDPSKVGRLVGARNQPIRFKAKSARSKENYALGLEICEDGFTHNPWDVGIAREAAESAEMLGYYRLAQWYLESVQSEAAKDADFFRHAAHVHELCEAWPKAIAAWETVKKIDPHDDEAHRKINGLSASATIKRAKYDDAVEKAMEDKPEQGPSKEEVEAELEKLKQEKLSPEDRLKKEIKSDPTQVWAFLELADIFRKRSQLEIAEKVLGTGIKHNPKDNMLAQTYADVQMTRMKRALDALVKRVEDDPTDAASKGKLDQLSKLLLDYEIKEYRRRLALNPEDYELHFQLGQCLAKNGEHAEAIGEFQIAKSSPTLKVQAMLQAGLSFEADGRGKLAERTYLDALKAVEPEDTANFNALHYQLGRVNETLGNMETAEEHYNEVAANDYTYLDVAQRLRNLN